MLDPFEFINAGKSFRDVLNVLAESNSDELQKTGSALSKEMIQEVEKFVRREIRSASVRHVLACGAMFHLLSFISDEEFVQKRFDDLLNELMISRTQAYRCRPVWTCFGKVFLQESGLQNFFCAEALKILSEEQTPQSARNEALQLAREGITITIKIAVTLKLHRGPEPLQINRDAVSRTHPIANSSSSIPSRQGKKRCKKWLFVGTAARIEVISTTADGVTDRAAVIHDLQAAIEELQRQDTYQDVA